MAINEEYLKKKAGQKKYEDRLNELRRASFTNIQTSLSAQEAKINEYASKFDQAIAHYCKVVKDRRQQLGSESFSILIIQMRPSLEAFSHASRELQMQFFCYCFYKVAANFNSRDSSLMGFAAENIRHLRVLADQGCNTEGHFSVPLPPVFVPYLAEVNEKGILSVDVTLPEVKMSPEDVQASNDFKAAVGRSVRRWINEMTDENNRRLYAIEATPEGEKIKILATSHYMSKEEFREFRNDSLEAELENEFGVDFKPEAAANIASPRP